MPGGKKPSAKREQAIAALLTSGTIEKAAAACGISERTLRNWLQEPGFRANYRKARRKLLDDAVLELQHAAKSAVVTLVTHMQGDKPGPAVRAAQIVLDQTFRGTEVLDLFEELEQLREEIRRVHADAKTGGEETPAADCRPNEEAAALAGEVAGGPGTDTQRGGTTAGPLADEASAGTVDESLAPLFPPGWEEPSGGSAGAG